MKKGILVTGIISLLLISTTVFAKQINKPTSNCNSNNCSYYNEDNQNTCYANNCNHNEHNSQNLERHCNNSSRHNHHNHHN